jgi:hypothetical protein
MAAFQTIALSAGLAGLLDISATATVGSLQGMPVKRLLQFVASGAIGKRAFTGGTATAAVGLAIHFLIAGAVATVYYTVSHVIPIGLDHPVLFGAAYGIGVHLIMSRMVVPLSRTPKREFSTRAFVTQLVIHICCVGLPIALTQHYLSR